MSPSPRCSDIGLPSEARNFDGAIAKSDMHLLGDLKGEPRKWRSDAESGVYGHMETAIYSKYLSM
ncbi:MAG: hypothetical protein LRZ87_00260, partial [Methanocellales archaeon]|nr:hypothetical protein [Methanocellales archaeon]